MPTKRWSDKLKEAEKAPSFKELDEDTYSFVINDAGKVGEYNSVEQISINPAVESGPRSGSRLFHNFNFPDDNPQVLRIVFEQFQALGLGEEFFQSEPSMEQVAQALKGRRFVAEVVHTTSKNDPSKKYVNLRNFKPAVSPSAVPAGPGGPGAGPAPAGPGMAQPQAPQAPQQFQQAPAQDAGPWAQQPQAPQVPQAPQQFQQPPAQPQPNQQTWQPPTAPPLG